jgi:hypothetical protein
MVMALVMGVAFDKTLMARHHDATARGGNAKCRQTVLRGCGNRWLEPDGQKLMAGS